MEVLEVKALLKIRSFEKGFDEQAYVRIYNTCFRDYDDIRSMTLDELREMEEFMSFSTDGVLIAEWNGEIAGMVNAYVDKQREEPKGFIQSLAVLPEFRGKGIATGLVEKAIESLRQRGMKTAEAWAQTDRKTCMHVFEGFGFKQARVGSVMKRIVADVPSNTRENNSVKMR
jgi:N-acetylglutamate synthase-like GNAT family acetyltransferase